MPDKPLVVGIIVARGGGSTFSRKNAYPLHGRPVLAWAVTALREAGFIDRVFVWTEDDALAAIARDAGAEPLARPKDMVHYFAGNWTLGEWHRDQDRQMRERLGRRYDYLVPFNCNCVCFSPESLRALYAALRAAGDTAFRIQAVSRVQGGLCLENPANGRLFPVWNDTDRPLAANPHLYRLVGVGIVDCTRPAAAHGRTLYHEVPPREGFDFERPDDIPFALHYLAPRAGKPMP